MAENVASTFTTALKSLLLLVQDQKIKDLNVLSPRDSATISIWNSHIFTRAVTCVHDIFSQRVAEQPSAPAIHAWDHKFTYQELGLASDRLASRLVDLGIGPEVKVPICFEKSAWTVVSMLAVLKAGGACVSIDPSHPRERLETIIKDCKARIIIAAKGLVSLFHHLSRQTIVLGIDESFVFSLPVVPNPVRSGAKAHNAAFVVYTSGSTGTPKGVVLEHASVCTSAQAHGSALNIGPQSRVLQFAAHIFDISIQDMFTTLTRGGCVCVPSEVDRVDNLAGVINELQINWACITPTVATLLVPAQVPTLRALTLAGEAVSRKVVDIWAGHVASLNNCYGPAESTIYCAWNGKVDLSRSPSNIGHGLSSLLWVVDANNHHRLLPIGCIGELLIEGPLLAREYLNDAEKTASSFIINPKWATLSRGQSRRMYKTGDLVRYNQDGSLDYLGRKDNQVKIHGQRLELGEIEQQLLMEQDVEEVIVVLPKTGPGRMVLTAITTLRTPTSVAESDTTSDSGTIEGGNSTPGFSEISSLQATSWTTASVVLKGAQVTPIHLSQDDTSTQKKRSMKSHLAARVPGYMVPAAWIIVDSIPLNTSGKLDRALVGRWVESLDDERYHACVGTAADEEVGPTTAMDRRIQTILSGVLNLSTEKVSLFASFQSLGGDSITAMQVVARARADGIVLRVQDILSARSVSELALVAKSSTGSSILREDELEKVFDLSPMQQFYFQISDGKPTRFNQSFLLRLSRPVTAMELSRAVETIVRQHSMLRARFVKANDSGRWRQLISKDTALSHRFHHHNIKSRADIPAILESSQQSLDIENGPVFTADMMDVAGDGQLVYLVSHHLVIDLVSWRVILHDLEYILENEELASDTPFPFQAWNKLQTSHAQNLLPTNALPFNVVPADYDYWGMSNIPNTYKDTATAGFITDANTTAMLLGPSQDSLRTEPAEVFIATLLYSFSQTFKDRKPPTLFTESHGREPWLPEIDISDTVGWFTTMSPIYVPRTDNIVDTVRHVKDTRRSVPVNGWSYFTSRFLNEEGKRLFGDHAPMEVVFNYLGRYQQLERQDSLLRPEPMDECFPRDVGNDVTRLALFEVSVIVSHSVAQFSIVYNRNMQKSADIEIWIQAWQHSLQDASLILSKLKKTATLSDFPLLSLSYDQLALLESERLPKLGLNGFSDVEDVYPCSPIQQGLLLSQARAPGNYEIDFMYAVSAKLGSTVDIGRLLSSWQQVVSRHPILRTLFTKSIADDGQYHQVVLRSHVARTKTINCRDDSDVITTFKAQAPLDHTKQLPRHQLTVCTTSPGSVYIRLEVSHTLIDATSISVVLRDIALAYDSTLPGMSPPLYSSYIQYIQSRSLDESIAYWNNFLSDLQPCHFPTGGDVHSVSEAELKSLVVELPIDNNLLKQFCKSNGVTTANVIQAAWGLVLRAYTGLDDVCFGYLSSGRDIPVDRISEAVGPLINMLVCRQTVSSSTGVTELVKGNLQNYVAALGHQHCSLAQMQSSLNLGGRRLFNTIMSVQRATPMTSLALASQEEPQLLFNSIGAHDPTEYDITVNALVSDNEISLSIGYWTSKTSDWVAENVSATFAQAFKSILGGELGHVQDLDLFSARDKSQMGVWNNNAYQRIEACVHDLFTRQVSQQPHSQAISGWDAEMTYIQLEELSNRLASHLIALGVGPNVIVPLCFNKSAWAIVSMLAVLKAGGACVSLDSSHPHARLEMIIRDVQPTVILMSDGVVDLLCDTFELKISVLGISQDFISSLPASFEQFTSTAEPSDPAFVVYTSGSTGVPKGVIIEHGAICTSIEAHGSVLGVGSQTRVLQFAAYVFDISLQDIFTTLTRGGCICILSDSERMNDISGAINRLNVNWAGLTPTVASLLRPTDVPTLKTLVLAGEAVSQEVVDIWSGHVSLNNCYGPAESTIYCAWNGQVGRLNSSPANIGTGLSSLLWVTDINNENILVPIGCIGELVIESPLLARGYLNDPEKTANSFIKDPAWVNSKGSSTRRMYKTGDLVRYNKDGTLDYLGRNDSQVKINGQRLEMGDIEHYVKLNMPNLSQVVVDLITPEIKDSKPHLAAFLVVSGQDYEIESMLDESLILSMSEDLEAKLKSLEASLAVVLPLYAVPKIYIPLQMIPRNSSGKSDRSKLRSIGSQLSLGQFSSFSLSNVAKTAPTCQSEYDLRTLWAQVLKIQESEIGLHDSFFRLGGDSLSAMRLVSSAQDAGIKATVADIFRLPTLQGMATTIKYGESEIEELQPFKLLQIAPQAIEELVQEAATKCNIDANKIEDIYPCTALQEGLILLSNTQAGAYVSQNVFPLSPEADIDRFCSAWETTARSALLLRTRIVHIERVGSLQVVINEPLIWQQSDNLNDYLLSDKLVPIAYGESLTRYAIVQQSDGSQYFVWTAHHATYDGWSTPLLFKLVESAFTNSTVPQVTPYSSFINYLSKIDREASDEFWRSQLSGVVPPSFPAPLPTGSTRKGSSLTQTVPWLKSPNTDITISTVIRASWAVVTARYSSAQESTFGVTLTGRNAPVAKIESIVGPTITTVPVRIVIKDKALVCEFLKEVQDQATSMIPFEHAGLQNIKNLSDDTRYACDFQNLLLIQPENTSKSEGATDSFATQQQAPTTPGFHTYSLVVECKIKKDSVDIVADFDEQVMDPVQMRRILQQFVHVIKQFNDRSADSTLMEQIDVFSPEDGIEVSSWNADNHDLIDDCVHNIVSQQVLARPHSPAIHAWDASFSYGELDELSSKLGHYLQELGVGPETMVPICFEKSAWTVVTMLAVLKAGGACVSMDPSHPRSRLQTIIREVNSGVVLAGAGAANTVSGIVENTTTIIVSETFINNLPSVQDVLTAKSLPQNSAFVVYTSGSTGTPKGVVIEHAAVCTSAHAHGAVLGLGPESRVLQFAAHVFDISIQDMFTTLMRGGCVCVPSEYERMNDLAGAINRMGVNWSCLTPTVAGLFQPEEVQLKTLVLAGEAVPKTIVDAWNGHLKLHNCYGPAESTIYCAWNGGLGQSKSPSNIGRGLSSRLWITEVSDHNRLTPIGCVGELLVEGPLLARGYLNDKAKTESSFIRDPTWTKNDKSPHTKSRRMYKTGDLVRYTSDGTLDYLGRKDTQVKIHGQRLELGEIQHQIKLNMPEFAHVVVDIISNQGRGGKKDLAAFFSFSDEIRVDGNQDLVVSLPNEMQSKLRILESCLANTLPSYAIPKVYVPLRSIPHNSSAKSDRKRLRAIGTELSDAQYLEFSLSNILKRQPQTTSETQMQQLWAEILKIEPKSIGLDDGFFRLGGDSLAAMRLVSAAREVELSITIEDVFRFPVLYQMATAMTQADSIIDVELQPFDLLPVSYNFSREDLLNKVARECGIATESIQDIYPCTALQEGLMILSNAKAGAYVSQNVYKISPSMELLRFRSAWETAINSSAIMRTRIVNIDDVGSLQVVTNEKPEWQLCNDLATYLQTDKNATTGYGKALSRYGIIEENEDRYLVWTAHHSIYDGWSIPLLFHLIERAYEANTVVTPTSYSKFIGYLTTVDKVASEKFWKSQLQGAIPPSFPVVSASNSVDNRLDGTITHTMKFSHSSASDITASTIIRAAWAIVTARYSGVQEATFGVTLTGRNAPVAGIETVMGPTITTVPVRVLADPSLPVKQFLRNVQDQATAMIPFEHTGLQNIKVLGTDAANACDFQNLLLVQPRRTSSASENATGVEFKSGGGVGFHTYALVLELTLTEDGAEVMADFDENAIEAAQMQRVIHQFQHVIQQISHERQDLRVGDIHIVSPEDKLAISMWNNKKHKRLETCVHSAFVGQASESPNAPAICAWDGELTYSMLDKSSDRLAHYLVSLGVGPEVLVPLCFEKSSWNVIATLSVLKAGGACVSLDSSHPRSRLAAIISDIKAEFILVSSSVKGLMADIVDHVISVDADLMDKLPDVIGIPNTSVRSNNTAFVIYTSGSTGVPKGVVLEHGSVYTSSTAHGGVLDIGPGSRVLQFAAHVFDISIQDIFTTLVRGGCVCIPSETDRVNDLVGVINRLHVNWTCITPTVASLLNPSDVPGLKTLTLAGEAISKKVVDIWAGSVSLNNCYGPAESTIYCSWNGSVGCHKSPSNIGRGLSSNLWITEVADYHRLAPVGCIGELLVEGPLLARGYLNDLEKTTSSFIENPKWAEDYPGTGRLYKTGDLVRYNTDGTLDYLGRKDSQVKLHGQRLELGDIEFHLMSGYDVENAMVILPKQGPGHQSLVAVIAPRRIDDSTHSSLLIGTGIDEMRILGADSTSLTKSTLREHLSSHVPSYMIPAVWILVDSIPLNTSGKLDRARVTRWVESMNDETYRESLGVDTEEAGLTIVMDRRLQSILGRVLNMSPESVALNRSFQGLGGDSITAMQVVTRARAEQITLRVQDVLRMRSISELSLVAKTSITSHSFDDEIGKLFQLSPMQQLYFEMSNGRANRFNQSFFFRLNKPVTAQELKQTIAALVRQHSMLRAHFVRDSGHWSQYISKESSGSYRLRVHDMTCRDGLTATLEDSQASIDIETGPIFVADLFNIQNDGQLLFLAAHHLVVDLVSWRVILHDLQELLETRSLSSSPLVPFQAWSRLQATHAQQKLLPADVLPFEVPKSNYEYWDMTNIPNIYQDAILHTFNVESDATALLLDASNKAFGTEPVELFMATLLHAFGQIFQDRTPPSIFTEGHGREPWEPEIDITDTVGWFTTVSPIYVNVSDDVLDTIRRTKDIRRKLPGNGWPYFTSRFLNESGIESFGHHMPMEVIFNYLGRYQQLESEDSLFKPENVGDKGMAPDFGADVTRMALIEISVVVIHGIAQCSVKYNRGMKHQEAITRWVQAWQECLSTIAPQLATMGREHTLSDFPLLSMTYQNLEKLKKEVLPDIGLTTLSDIEDIYPCSPMQKGILLSQVRKPGFYEIDFMYVVKPAQANEVVDVQRLLSSWQLVVTRHPMLRTVFTDGLAVEGVPEQIVLKSTTDRTIEISCIDDEDVIDTFKAQPPLQHTNKLPRNQFTILRTARNHVYIRLEISHAAIDAASMSVILKDMALAYESKLPRGSGSLYSHYVEYLQSRPIDLSMKFWGEYLNSAQPCHFPASLELSNEKQPPKELRSLAIECDLPDNTLKEFCISQGVTIANIVQAVWSLVLRLYTGSDDVCFGYLSSGRDIAVDGIEEVVGPLINMLVCRLQVLPAEGLTDLVQKVQENYLASMEHQHCSLAQIQHALKLGGRALFNTIVSVQRGTPTKSSAESASPTIIHAGPQPEVSFISIGAHDPTEVSHEIVTSSHFTRLILSQYDITVNVLASDSDLAVSLSYWSSSVSNWMASNVASTFSVALKSITSGKVDKIENLDLFSGKNKSEVSSWNNKSFDKMEACVHDIFSQQVQARPEEEAVCGWDGSFTYAELDNMSNSLAKHLVHCFEIGPGVVVPYCFEKSAWTAIAILAVLKAGGACVALDPTHPKARLEKIILDVGSQVILASAGVVSLLSDIVGPTVLGVDSLFIDNLNTPDISLRARAGPHDPAYIVYTSGSTGVPKGVIIEHASICTSGEAHGTVLNISPESRVLQFAAYVFDISIQDILTTLMRGGCICVLSEAERVDDLAGAITRLKANWVCLTPTVATLLNPSDVPGLRTLALAGEAVSKRVVNAWAGYVDLHNCYGPAESTIYCSWNGSVGRKSASPANIGQGLSSVLWVTDVASQDYLVPIGCIGELLVEGPLLARGYLNDPEKTAASFITEPLWSRTHFPGTQRRLYKTGDLVRYNSDGTLDYLGRKDSQVKIHGQRLELGEVEHHLNTDERVDNVIALVPKIGLAQQKLVAVTSLKQFPVQIERPSGASLGLQIIEGESTTRDKLRLESDLSAKVPGYLVPKIWVIVDAIPLNISGKLDRAQVSRWMEQMDETTFNNVLLTDTQIESRPTTAIDRRIQVIISQVLNIPSAKVHLHRSFQALGGDSITAMQVVTRARADNISLRVQEILGFKSISELVLAAKVVDGASGRRQEETEEPFSLSPMQELYFQVEGGNPSRFNQSFFLKVTKPITPNSLAGAIETLVRQHSMLRARFARDEEGQWTQRITKNPLGSYQFREHVVDRDNINSIIEQSQASIDISTGPLFVADLFDTDDNQQLLFLAAHHLVIDLVSWRVLLHDLEEVLLTGSLSSNPPLSFQAWNRLQASHAETLSLSNVLPFNVVPADYAYWGMDTKANVFHERISESFVIDVDLTTLLMGRCQEAFDTDPVEVFLATLIHAFKSVFTDRTLPTVYSEGHGRESWDPEVDISDTVGWFTTIFPLCVQSTLEDSIGDIVRRTKDVRRSLPGNGWPYFASRYLNSEGKEAFKDHLPMEVIFNYLGRYQQLERDDALLKPEPINSTSDVSADAPRLALFEASVVVTHGMSQFTVVYNRHMQHQDKIQRWIQTWKLSIELAATSLSQMPPQKTLSDFPLLEIKYEELDKICNVTLPVLGVESTDIEEIYPCSPMQQGLLLSQARLSGSYAIDSVYEVKPSETGQSIDIERLLSAWQQVVDRHSALRTIFAENTLEGELPIQIVLRRAIASTRQIICNEEDQDLVIAFLKSQPAPQHSKYLPSHHLTVCTTADDRTFIRFEMTHAITDATSSSLILRDIALAFGGSLPTGERPLYSDYIRYTQERPIHAASDYWKSYLSGTNPCHFPISPANPLDGYSQELRSVSVDIDLPVDSLRQFCMAHNVTTANLVQAIWGLVLQAYTGSNEVCFGYLTLGRDISVKDISNIVGPLINILVCRIIVPESCNLVELVQCVQQDYLNGLEHQHCSLAQMQRGLNLGGRPLFNTVMSIQRVLSGGDSQPKLPLLFDSIGAHDPTEVRNPHELSKLLY